MSGTIQEAIAELRLTLIKYIEANYHIGDPQLVAHRRELLERVGGIFQVPFIESTPRYQAGPRFAEMAGVPAAARDAYRRLAQVEGDQRALLFDPPYTHQGRAIDEILARGRNLMITTGTGSGKTESFLLPILGKLAIEARDRPAVFRGQPAVRAMILYPMNALVNDQLGRLRLLLGHRRVVDLFQGWAGRPVRFTRYTSRTPYPGVRSRQGDQDRLGEIGDFYAAVERLATRGGEDDENAIEARRLYDELLRRGKWPAKESVADWYGEPNARWQDNQGRFRRAVTRPRDAELLTRHETQAAPPDVLITNYSMLEYMMMRPIERTIFDHTHHWLASNRDERFLVVLDEAHLYRGAAGAEVGLLMRRLRERLGIDERRFQVICATASFGHGDQAATFGAQLTSCPEASFTQISGDLLTRAPAAPGTQDDVRALCTIDLDGFYSEDVHRQLDSVAPFLRFRGVNDVQDIDLALHTALDAFPPLNLLVNATMQQARRLDDLAPMVFPNAETPMANRALTALLATGSRAKQAQGAASLIPCRVHSFFRGLPGLWVCMDPNCAQLPAEQRGRLTGRLYDQPQERCGCGARVLEYFTCRNCGASYARAYTNDLADPHMVWASSGERLHTQQGPIEGVHALDLLLEETDANAGEPAFFDLETGHINPNRPPERARTVWLPPATARVADADHGGPIGHLPGQFVPCGICRGAAGHQRSSVQDHQTEGDQPFQALVASQIAIQPPGPQLASAFAPLRGRKVLLFSDSRQMAARLAPRLQSYSARDAARTLVAWGFSFLRRWPRVAPALSLESAFAAAMIAANRLEVSLRPELRDGEVLPDADIQAAAGAGAFENEDRLLQLWMDLTPRIWPRAIIETLTKAIADRFLGLEALAIASIRERENLTQHFDALPNLPGLATDPASKRAVARAWLRYWVTGRSPVGIWYNSMPTEFWAQREVRGHNGNFDRLTQLLVTNEQRRIFRQSWLSVLTRNGLVVERTPDGSNRLVARALTLEFDGAWCRCPRCKSVHRPIPNVAACIDCGRPGVVAFDPATDAVFAARKGYYRSPIIACLADRTRAPVALIAAEHTAQLNTSQSASVFSAAERHELLFQDVELSRLGGAETRTAIDVLSSTTTMEVGIDIGALSGVALRNMPPGRANYQQRSGRAGRRGNAVATVMAYGSADSHDEHYFTHPAEMITGQVIDPRLTLENVDIARRHIRAFLLQRYHEARIQGVVPGVQQNLFSVLGTVGDFRDGTGVLNRADFARWLSDNRANLQDALRRWLPTELAAADREGLINGMEADALAAIDHAIGFVEVEAGEAGEGEDDDGQDGADEAEQREEAQDDGAMEDGQADPLAQNLLERLLYHGVLPRYAFPTDVASFYIFDVERSTRYRTVTRFEPSQGLPIALSQYAPGKQVWVAGRCYTSKAIYSPHGDARRQSWRNRQLYYECQACGHARKTPFSFDQLGVVQDCEACGTQGSFGPARSWFKPPGFAHPVDTPAETEPDRVPEASRATRAKLTMPTPPDAAIGWMDLNERLRSFPTRDRLLVSNTGLNSEGYTYCRSCGRIESADAPEVDLFNPHSRPYPGDQRECPGSPVTHTILGTDFPTDVTLFSMRLQAPFRLQPGVDETTIALRTVCEALARAACRTLELEQGEILAEFRPALTALGVQGAEAEIFIYDTLPGGAGFSTQLAERGHQLFQTALDIMTNCAGNCDASCYRCLRSFRNKFEHGQIDRFVGAQLLQHVLQGGVPQYNDARVNQSADLLFGDLRRQSAETFACERNAERIAADGHRYRIPIVVRRNATGAETWVALASPIAEAMPAHAGLAGAGDVVVCLNEMVVRKNLPAAVQAVFESAR